MSFEWPVVDIADVCSVGDGAHSKVQRMDRGVLYLTSKNIGQGTLKLDKVDYISEESFSKLFPVNSKATRRPEAGDVLLGIIGTFGNAYIYKESDSFGFSSSIGILRPDKAILNSGYLYYVISSPKFKVLHASSDGGSVQGYTNIPTIKKLPLPLPPLVVQESIANLLRSLDDRITLLRETNATLEAITQALFKSWFVDFDPVRAKAEGRQPEGMDAPIAALFPDSFEESELGLVPKGWRVGSLSDVCSIASGKRPPDRSDALTEACSIPLYGGAGLMGYTSATLFDEELIVTGRVGTLGKVHIAYPPFWASDNVLVVSPKLATDFSFTLHWIRSIDVHALNRGSTQPLLTQRDLGAQQGLIPPRGVLQQFEEIVAPLYVRMRAQELQAQTLTQLRDTLLPRLISGQLRLPEAQAWVAEVG